MDSISGMAPWVYLIILVLAITFIVAWIVLPFAIIGTKPILLRLLREQERTNELLESILAGQQPRR